MGCSERFMRTKKRIHPFGATISRLLTWGKASTNENLVFQNKCIDAMTSFIYFIIDMVPSKNFKIS